MIQLEHDVANVLRTYIYLALAKANPWTDKNIALEISADTTPANRRIYHLIHLSWQLYQSRS